MGQKVEVVVEDSWGGLAYCVEGESETNETNKRAKTEREMSVV